VSGIGLLCANIHVVFVPALREESAALLETTVNPLESVVSRITGAV
jgi:hypothetical protein